MENLLPQFANLAIRIEGKGQYNIAKYVRAAIDSLLRKEAYALHYQSDNDSVLNDLESVIRRLEDMGFDEEIITHLRRGHNTIAQNKISKLPEFATPRVCRRCGYVLCQTGEKDCPNCAADSASFAIHHPIYWMREFDPFEAMTRLKQTPNKFRHRLNAIPAAQHTSRPTPDSWSPFEVMKHIRDAQIVLHTRVIKILEEDNPYLDFQQVWAWADKQAMEESATDLFNSYSASRSKTIEVLEVTPLENWWRTANHEEFGPVTLLGQISYFTAHEITHLRQLARLTA